MKYCELMIRDYSVIPSGIGSSGITSSSTTRTNSNNNNAFDCGGCCAILFGMIVFMFSLVFAICIV